MDGFLVVSMHMGQDIPCGLFDTHEAAVEFARKIPWSLKGVVPEQMEPHNDEWDAFYMVVVAFVDGKPTKWEFVRHYEEDCVLPPDQRLNKDMERYARALRDKAAVESEEGQPTLFEKELTDGRE